MSGNDSQQDSKKKEKNSIVSVSPAEFAQIPLDFIISSPLLTTINAHQVAAATTLNFINELKDPEKSVQFDTTVTQTDEKGVESTVGKKIEVPLLALVKVPCLNFDSLSISFSYNISQVHTEKVVNNSNAALDLGTTGILSKFVNAKLTGSVSHTASRENTASRGGTLDVKVHVSESELPAGLQKVINAITDNIPVKEI